MKYLLATFNKYSQNILLKSPHLLHKELKVMQSETRLET